MQAIDIEGKEVYTTYGEFVLSCQPTEMMTCSHEEADTRLVLHAYHASQSGYRKILIRTVDTDVVVLAVSRVQHLSVDEIWMRHDIVLFRKGENICLGRVERVSTNHGHLFNVGFSSRRDS